MTIYYLLVVYWRWLSVFTCSIVSLTELNLTESYEFAALFDTKKKPTSYVRPIKNAYKKDLPVSFYPVTRAAACSIYSGLN